jgi:putative resolvase
VRAERVGPRTIKVFPNDVSAVVRPVVGGLGLYATVSSHDQKADLVRQSDRLSVWVAASGMLVVAAMSEVGLRDEWGPTEKLWVSSRMPRITLVEVGSPDD